MRNMALKLGIAWLALSPSAPAAVKGGKGVSSFYSMDPLGKYQGKVALVVNTASKCGFTPQYKDLESLYEKYQDQGFVVLGFPSNDFGAQEPGSDAEIKKFCELNYKVKFPLMPKAPVKGEAKQPAYKYLTEKTREDLRGEVEWNFEKFLVGKDGQVVARFKSKVSPSDPQVTSKIEALLK
jgi:glutathione peroxidase